MPMLFSKGVGPSSNASTVPFSFTDAFTSRPAVTTFSCHAKYTLTAASEVGRVVLVDDEVDVAPLEAVSSPPPHAVAANARANTATALIMRFMIED